MTIPLQITFRHFDGGEQVRGWIRSRARRLQTFRNNLRLCRVAVERPHRHERSGNPYRVRIELRVPGSRELVVTEQPGKHRLDENLRTIIHHAFDAAQRQLESLTARQRNDVKRHDEQLAIVASKFDREGYGFLRTLESDQDVYFHENSVTGGFDSVGVGALVRYEAELGDKGLQATSVQVLDGRGRSSERPAD